VHYFPNLFLTEYVPLRKVNSSWKCQREGGGENYSSKKSYYVGISAICRVESETGDSETGDSETGDSETGYSY
jgi:hypothetical protein